MPKANSPISIRDYRPISCCDVVYKCIAKILANRLQPILPKLIHQPQSTFVKVHITVDNVLLMKELVRGYHRDERDHRCAIKIDLMKDYDSVDCPFIFDTMYIMGFPSTLIQWVRTCVCSAKFSAVINGFLEGYF